MDDEEKVSLGQHRVIAETNAAVKVTAVQGGVVTTTMWVPKSVIHDDSEVYGGAGDEGDLVVFAWWAEKEGHI